MLELIGIISENDNFTGQVMVKEEVHDKNLLHNEESLYIINDNKQVLLQQ